MSVSVSVVHLYFHLLSASLMTVTEGMTTGKWSTRSRDDI